MLWTYLIIGAVALLVLLILFRMVWRVAEPNEALIISGLGAHSSQDQVNETLGFKIVVGRGTAVLPGFQTVRRLPLDIRATPLTVTCVSSQGIPLHIKGVTAYKNALLRRYSLALYLTHNFVSAPATFFRRAALEEAGGFDERYRISVDYDLQLRIARRHDPVILERYLAAFRMVEGTLSMSGFRTQFREHAEQARRHGDGHRAAVAINQVLSAAIVGVYDGMRRVRAARSRTG